MKTVQVPVWHVEYTDLRANSPRIELVLSYEQALGYSRQLVAIDRNRPVTITGPHEHTVEDVG